MGREAIVTRSTGGSYTIRDSATGERLESLIRGKLRLRGVRTTNPVAVGDVVEYETDENGQSFITSIIPRRNYIIRRASNLSKESHVIAANLDQAALVVTLFQPETKPEFIDRFLVTCEAYGIPAIIVLNKSDLAHEAPGMLEEFRRTYTLAGYPILETSTVTDEGIEALGKELDGKTTLLAGNSGVGKSSLIKRLIPGVEIRTAGISDHHGKGKHTTTHYTMYDLPGGGSIIDSPGIKGFGLIDIESAELWHFFPELMKFAPGCQFYNCTHVHEPGCAVIDAVGRGEIAGSRYISYLKTLEEDEKYRK